MYKSNALSAPAIELIVDNLKVRIGDNHKFFLINYFLTYGLRDYWECRAGSHSAKANVGIEVLDIDGGLPGVGEDGMPGRNEQ
jgi:hypothetical protein